MGSENEPERRSGKSLKLIRRTGKSLTLRRRKCVNFYCENLMNTANQHFSYYPGVEVQSSFLSSTKSSAEYIILGI